METLSICVRLCEQGINPEALSAVIKELRRATETLKVRHFDGNEKNCCRTLNTSFTLLTQNTHALNLHALSLVFKTNFVYL